MTTWTITVTGEGGTDDDLRAAFSELVRTLRAEVPLFDAHLDTGNATYAANDIPDDEPADDEPDEED